MTRQRSRSVDIGEGTVNAISAVPAECKKLMRECYTENKAANNHAGLYKKARKELLGKMTYNKKDKYVISTTIDGSLLTLQAEIKAGDVVEMDMAKLKEAIGEESFMEIVKATKEAIVDVAGKAVYESIITTKKGAGSKNVTVSVAK